MILLRKNPNGLSFVLSGNAAEDKTRIQMIGNFKKFLYVNVNILDMNSFWYHWQIKGKSVQDAFPMLSPDEREFMMTGIMPDEWNKVMGVEK